MSIQRSTRGDRVPEISRLAIRDSVRMRRSDGRPRRPGLRSLTPHLTASQYARLLEVIDEAGVVTIDGISRALPQVSQPVSAIFDLCDAGILNVDWEAAFDGDVHVWRIGR